MATLKSLARAVSITSRWDDSLWREDWSDASPYRVTLRYQGRQLTVPFYMGPALTHEPEVEEVLDSLLSDAQAGELDFEEFCAEMGYDQDSRKAEQTWKACGKMAPRLRRLLGSAFEEFLYAER